MKLFKNFQTKRQLREENERLKFMLNRPQPTHLVERDVQKVCCSIDIEDGVPMHFVKQELMFRLSEQLKPFVEWDIDDCEETFPIERQIKGSIYVVIRATNNLESEETDNE